MVVRALISGSRDSLDTHGGRGLDIWVEGLLKTPIVVIYCFSGAVRQVDRAGASHVNLPNSASSPMFNLNTDLYNRRVHICVLYYLCYHLYVD